MNRGQVYQSIDKVFLGGLLRFLCVGVVGSFSAPSAADAVVKKDVSLCI